MDGILDKLIKKIEGGLIFSMDGILGKIIKKIWTGVEYFKWDKIFKKRFRGST
ncbi:MAG: hypothetical protein Q4Q19_03740 [Methanobrevibacter sp.]|nr:hypothetical protein [Methanobrevibacter sp.]